MQRVDKYLKLFEIKAKKIYLAHIGEFCAYTIFNTSIGRLFKLKLNLLFYIFLIHNEFYEFTNLVGNDSDPASIAFNSLATDSINKS
jgi:hypothetical protein